MDRHKQQEGFTLIELMATLGVLALIITIAVPVIGNMMNDAQAGSKKVSISMIEEAGQLAYLGGLEFDTKEQYFVPTLVQEGYLQLDKDNTLYKASNYVVKEPNHTFEFNRAVPHSVDLEAYDNVVYVSALAGGDTNIGSSEQPVQTIEDALALANSGDAIVLQKGDYDVRSFRTLFEKPNIDYIGTGIDTHVYVNQFSTFPAVVNNDFYKMVLSPSQSFPVSTGLIVGASRTDTTFTSSFYNVAFTDPYNRIDESERHSSYIAGDKSRYIAHDYKRFEFINSIALDIPLVTTWSDYNDQGVHPNIQVIASATDVSSITCPDGNCGLGYGHDILDVIDTQENAVFDDTFHIIEPANTEAGVYNGKYAWSTE